MRVRVLWEMLRETAAEWSEDRAPRMAAALSYYTLFSLVPLLVLVIAGIGALMGGDRQVRADVLAQVGSLAGPEAARALAAFLDPARGGGGAPAGLLGAGALMFGAAGVFGQLKDALNRIWDVRPTPRRGGVWSLARRYLLSFAAVATTGFLLLVSIVISAGFETLRRHLGEAPGALAFGAAVLNAAVSLGVSTLVFALVFRFLPDRRVPWRDVWVGGAATALMFSIGKEIVGAYLGGAGVTSVYGAAGSLVAVLVWVYYSAQIVLFGAEFTHVHARRRLAARGAGEGTTGARSPAAMPV